MKTEWNPLLRKAVGELEKQKEDNLEVSDLYNAFLEKDYASIRKEDVHEWRSTASMSEEEAYFTSLLLLEDINPNDPEIERLKETNGIQEVRKIDPKLLLENPYYKAVGLVEDKEGPLRLEANYFAPYEGFLYDDVYVNPERNYEEKTPLGFFSSKVPYLQLVDRDQVWMSLTPQEVNTMERPLREMKGNVVTYGLGLGYFAYRAALKLDVHSVTVVEKDPRVIRLFERNILPRLEVRRKIHVVQEDAFDFLALQKEESQFDAAFFDLYHTADDGLPMYLKAKKAENPRTKTYYWIESSILALFRRYVLTLLFEDSQGMKDEDYAHPVSDEEKLLLRLRLGLADLELKTPEELRAFLSDDSLRELAQKI